jgi:DNA-binding SARP family transcriptional activator/tetratricopeptide (TPR) repeat protein
MEIKIPGPLEIGPPSRPPDLRRAKERSLLAILAINAGETLTSETLIRRAWDDDNPSGARMRTLHSYLSHIRDVVTDTDGGMTRLESNSAGYRLRLDRECVDLHRFRRLRDQAKALTDSGEAERAVALLREAEGLSRGPALAGLPGQWVAGFQHRLEEELRAVTKRRLELELGLGRHAELTAELHQLSSQFPLDEQYIGYNMRALYQSGRQADALGLFHEARRRFDELGMQLSPGLTVLYERILRHDPELAMTPARRRATLLPQSAGLPQRVVGFVGREAEIAALAAPCDRGHPIVHVIDGPGGVGKTSLAVEVAERLRGQYPDPPVFLRFHAHEAGQVPLDQAEALRQLIEMLGIPPAPRPRSMGELIALWQQEAQGRRSVIILDDVPGREAIAAIVPRSGSCLTLVTTRQRLGSLPGGVAVRSLDVLPEDTAVALFTRTAGPAKIDDPLAVLKAVRLCSCLPLALTVTASGLRDGGPTVAEWVADIAALRALPSGFGALSPQLAATFERSYEGLDAGHREFFRRLAMIPCPDFSVGTAAVVVGTGMADAQSAMTTLHSRHLVEWGGTSRFRFHDLVRWYASFVAERDDPAWERRLAERRLLDYYLREARHADRLLYPYRGSRGSSYAEAGDAGSQANLVIRSRQDARKWLELEWRNALRLADYAARHEWKQDCADLASVLAEFLEANGLWEPGAEAHHLAVSACRDISDPSREARAAGDLCLLELRTGSYKDALLHAGEAVDIYRSLGDQRGEAELVDRLGTIRRYMGHTRDALAYHEESLYLYSECRDKHGMAEALFHAGTAYYGLGRYSEAIERLGRARVLYQETGDRRGEAKASNNIGDMLLNRGFHRDAVEKFEKALEVYQDVGARQEIAILRLNMGHIAQSRGRYEEAIAEYRAALESFRETGDILHKAWALHDIGEAYQLHEAFDAALVHHQQAAAIARDIGDLRTQAITEQGVADSLRGCGRYAEALERYRSVLRISLETEDIYQKGKALAGVAETRYRMHDLKEARIFWRQALDAFRVVAVPEAEDIGNRLAALESGQ